MAASCSVEQTVAVDLGALLDARDGAVVTLVAGETRLAAHKAVLSARSRFFEALLRQKEDTSEEVSIPNVEGPVLRQLLAYLYTLQVPQLPPSLTPQLLAAAQRYRVLGLMNECEKQLAAQLSVETAAAAAFLAVKYGCPRLEEAAISFIKAHTHQVMNTKGWEDALRSQPEDAVEVTRLLAEPVETSVPAAPDGLPTAGAQRQHQRQSQPHRRTPVAAVPPTPPHNTPPPVDDAVSPLQSLSAVDKGRKLIDAAREGAVGDVETLLAAGADVGARTGGSDTALHEAADEGHVEVVRRLLGAGAEVDARDTRGCTPLHRAARHGHAAVARLLVAACADPDARQHQQWTPLHCAARYGHTAVARFLLVSSADVDARDQDSCTPLHYAAEQGHTAVVHLLVTSSANVDARSKMNRTPLHKAARYGDAIVMQLLVASSADVDARHVSQWTPLHEAAYGGHAGAAAVLLKAGADRGARTDKGDTPLDLAKQKNHQQLIDMLT